MDRVNVLRFLELIGSLVIMKNGGSESDVSRLVQLAAIALRAGETGRRHLALAVKKVEQLVAEDRSLNEEELAWLDGQIHTKLSRAALVDIPSPVRPEDPPPPPAEEPPPPELETEPHDNS